MGLPCVYYIYREVLGSLVVSKHVITRSHLCVDSPYVEMPRNCPTDFLGKTQEDMIYILGQTVITVSSTPCVKTETLMIEKKPTIL